ncbi:MAG: hypothetical protein ACODAQ_09240, partial [Phycisphaeraceae bacterium]
DAVLLGWQRLPMQFGWAILLLCAAATALLLWRRRTRGLVLLAGIHAMLAFVLFLRVDQPGIHHYYLLLPAAWLVLTLGLVVVIQEWPRRIGVSVAVVAGLVMAANTVHVLAWPLDRGPMAPLARALLPDRTYPPVQRNDIDELQRLIAVLDEHGADEDVAVLGHSWVLNHNGLLWMNKSLGISEERDRRYLNIRGVDRRDGFPTDLLKAEFVIALDPPALSLRARDSQIIVLPNATFLENRDIAKAFERLPYSFSLENGHTAYLFRRVRPHTREEVLAFSERLRERYPDRPFVYEPPADLLSPE